MVAERLPFDRDGMAKWYARRHLATDDAILGIHYLPEGAPAREIRLIEVNKLVAERTPMEPIDYGVDVGGADPHTLYVLDVTPNQWEMITNRDLPLPSGWTLEKSVPVAKR